MKPIICLITGPAGVGKSTITKNLASQFKNSARIDVDYVREMIVNGYANPFPTSKRAEEQINLAKENTCALALNFNKLGFNVFIDDVVVKKQSLDFYFKKFGRLHFFAFLLFYEPKELQRRDMSRPKGQIMGQRALQLHKNFSLRLNEKRWQMIETTNQNVNQTTTQISKTIKNKFKEIF